MQTGIGITYFGLLRTDAIDASVRHHAARLDPRQDQVAGLRARVERWESHHRQGSTFRVNLEVRSTDGTVWVAESSSKEEVVDAVEQAFDLATRRLASRSRSSASVPHPPLSDEARRLLPLHGRFTHEPAVPRSEESEF